MGLEEATVEEGFSGTTGMQELLSSSSTDQNLVTRCDKIIDHQFGNKHISYKQSTDQIDMTNVGVLEHDGHAGVVVLEFN